MRFSMAQRIVKLDLIIHTFWDRIVINSLYESLDKTHLVIYINNKEMVGKIYLKEYTIYKYVFV